MANFEYLKELVYAGDNNACFIERERIVNETVIQLKDYDKCDKYALILSEILKKVSVPVDENDIFVGRVVEALPDEGMQAPNNIFRARGHMTFEYERLLTKGLSGILKDIEKTAKEKGDEKSQEFLHDMHIVVNAIKDYSLRYSKAAKESGNLKAAKALEKVPFEPAYDLYSALQSIWLINMISHCYVGQRDYAFGRMDQYLYPYYIQELESGTSHEEIIQLLTGFFIKTNEITGTATWNYNPKPILSQSTKQYVVIGGSNPNELSIDILKAAEINDMAEPVFTVLLKPEADKTFTEQVFKTMSKIADKMHVYNHNLNKKYLLSKGVSEEMAEDYTYTACCNFDLNYHSMRFDFYVPSAQILCNVLGYLDETELVDRFEQRNVTKDNSERTELVEYNNLQEILNAFYDKVKEWTVNKLNRTFNSINDLGGKHAYVFDALLIGKCAEKCRYPDGGGYDYYMPNIFFPGIATVADSISAIDKLVFIDKRYSLCEFIQIVKNNFEGNQELRAEIMNLDKFGNDKEVDKYATKIANLCLDVVDSLNVVNSPEGVINVGAFYSLDSDYHYGINLPATPDGRLEGTPISENQSPVYGCDKNGVTAMFKSLAKLPFHRAPAGGLNVLFSSKISAEILQSLIVSYFELGGLNVGITIVDKKVLEDAMINPERYKSLTVRLYGFSEYFVSLPKWQQIAVINRSEH